MADSYRDELKRQAYRKPTRQERRSAELQLVGLELSDTMGSSVLGAIGKVILAVCVVAGILLSMIPTLLLLGLQLGFAYMMYLLFSAF